MFKEASRRALFRFIRTRCLQFSNSARRVTLKTSVAAEMVSPSRGELTKILYESFRRKLLALQSFQFEMQAYCNLHKLWLCKCVTRQQYYTEYIHLHLKYEISLKSTRDGLSKTHFVKRLLGYE